jgi:hypothetical protein
MDSFCSVRLVELPGSCDLNAGVLVRDRRYNVIQPPTTVVNLFAGRYTYLFRIE